MLRGSGTETCQRTQGSIVPALASLEPSFRLRGTFHDTESTSRGGLQGYLDGRADYVDAIVGATRSAVSEAVSTLAGIEHLPQLSYASSAPILKDKTLHPTFARTYPNDALSAKLVVKLIISFSWKNVAVLHVKDEYGIGFVQATILTPTPTSTLTIQNLIPTQ
eukprot:4852298-Prymnesium_polylepis.1